jgi:predicted RNase H-like HicB family nuclease
VQDEQASVLARDANVAIVHLAGRKFPGVHMQGDTFMELRRQPADAVGRLQRTSCDGAVVDELDDVLQQMTEMLRLYEATLLRRGIQRPYHAP